MTGIKRKYLSEQKEDIDPEIVSCIAEILSISEEAIKNFNDNIAAMALANTKESSTTWNNLNPIEEIFLLHKEIIALYERLINEKEEMIIVLERMALK